MGQGASRKVFLTFDVEGPPRREDLVNTETITWLHRVLKLLEKYQAKGLFFITGSAAKKLGQFPRVCELLKRHEIGYHSSTHSIEPRIFEYNDIEDYESAVEVSKERETSTIDLDTGCIVGEGGILLLREMFPDVEVASFRAPFLCWSPSHLEAMRELGLRYDFSTSFWPTPVIHKGITFFPSPIAIDSFSSRVLSMNCPSEATGEGHHVQVRLVLSKMLRERVTVLLLHPALLGFAPTVPSHKFYKNVGSDLGAFKFKNLLQTRIGFLNVESLLAELVFLRKIGAIDVTPPPRESRIRLDPEKIDVDELYRLNLRKIVRLFHYSPKFMLSHLRAFFS